MNALVDANPRGSKETTLLETAIFNMNLFSKRSFSIKFESDKGPALEYLRGMLIDTRTTTILSLKKVFQEDVDWQYKEGWNTVGGLLSHIIAIEQYFRIVYLENRPLTSEENLELTPAMDMGIHIPSLRKNQLLDKYIEELTMSREKLLKSLSGITDEQFQHVFFSSDYNSECNLAWILYHMNEDEIYHRGQISILVKLRRREVA